jgi:hypothetical protein
MLVSEHPSDPKLVKVLSTTFEYANLFDLRLTGPQIHRIFCLF